MKKLSIHDPDQFQMATILTKNSKTGLTSNKRLLVIKKGYLYYYSKIPKTFKGDAKVLESYHELPKCSIEILNIKKINGYQNNSSYFSIEFDAKHMMEREDIRKTMTLEEFNFAPKNTKQIITWQFTCENQFVKQNWVSALTQLQAHFGKEKTNIQKYFDSINKKEESISKTQVMPVRSSTRVPWKQDQLKRSGSNENIHRSSYLNTMIQNNRMSSQKKKLRSDSKSISKGSDGDFIKKSAQENIVEIFIKQEKEKQKDQSQSMKEEGHDNIATPVKPSSSAGKLPIYEEQKGEQILQPIPKSELDVKKISNEISQRYQTPASTDKLSEVNAVTAKTPSENVSPHIKQAVKEKSDDKKVIIKPPFQLFQQKVPTKEKAQSKEIKNTEIKQPIQPPFKLEQINNKSFKQVSPQKWMPKKQNRKEEIQKSQVVQKEVQIKISDEVETPPKNKQKALILDDINFYDIQFDCYDRQHSFSRKLEAQKKLNSFIGTFIEKAQQQFMQFVNSKQHSQSLRYKEMKVSERLSHLQIGYLKLIVGYTITRNVKINGKNRIFYDEQQTKNLKKSMKVYNYILSSLIKAYKTEPENLRICQILHYLRIPQCVYIEYRGIACLVYDQHTTDQQQTLVTLPHELEQLKELFQAFELNFNCFQFKKCTTNGSQNIIPYITNVKGIYLNENSHKKHHNVTFRSPINVQFIKTANEENASTSLSSISKYLKGIKTIKNTENFTCPKTEMLSALQYIYICKYFRKFYRASQGEINQKNFLNLLFKGDQNLLKVFETAGYQFESMSKWQNKKFNAVFFDFLEYYTGICCSYNPQHLKNIDISPLSIHSKEKVNIVSETKIKTRVIGYNLAGFQLYESFSKIEKYISNKDSQLATSALELQQSTYFDNPYQQNLYPIEANLICVFNSAQLNFVQNDYISSINHCKSFLQSFVEDSTAQEDEVTVKQHTPHIVIPIYLLLLKSYSKFSPDKFSIVLKQLSDIVIRNYGQESSLLVTIFSFVAAAFSSMGEQDKSRRFMDISITICEKVSSKQTLLTLYLDKSRMLKNQNKLEQAIQILGYAKDIFDQIKGSSQQKLLLQLMCYQLELLLALPKTILNEEKLINIVNKLQNQIKIEQAQPSILQQLYKMQYNHGRKLGKPEFIIQSLQKMWECLDSHAQVLAVELGYEYVLHLNKDRLQGIHSEAYSIQKSYGMAKEKAIILLQQTRQQNYGNLVQMIEQCLLEENIKVLGAIYSLIFNSSLLRNMANQR